MPSSPGAGRSFPFIPVAALPSFWDACFLGAVVLGGLFGGANGSGGGRGLSSEWWLLESSPMPLGAGEGSGAGACSGGG